MPYPRHEIDAAKRSEFRVGSSRFLSQGAFIVYKLALAAYYLFWAIYWPLFEGFGEQAVNQLTFWTWDVCTGYFLVSALTGLLCWRRATSNKGRPGTASAFAEPASSFAENDRSAHERRTNTTIPPPSRQLEAAATALSAPMATVVAAPTRGATVMAAEGGGLISMPPVPRGLRWLQLILWNIASVGSLVITLVWASGDYLRQIQEGVVTNFDIQAHGLVAFFMLVDQMLIADDFKLKHVIISQVYGLIYLGFSVFWYFLAPEDDKYLYEGTLDWERNSFRACILGALAVGVLVPLVALVPFFVCRLREAVHDYLQGRRAAARDKREASMIADRQLPSTYL